MRLRYIEFRVYCTRQTVNLVGNWLGSKMEYIKCDISEAALRVPEHLPLLACAPADANTEPVNLLLTTQIHTKLNYSTIR